MSESITPNCLMSVWNFEKKTKKTLKKYSQVHNKSNYLICIFL